LNTLKHHGLIPAYCLLGLLLTSLLINTSLAAEAPLPPALDSNQLQALTEKLSAITSRAEAIDKLEASLDKVQTLSRKIREQRLIKLRLDLLENSIDYVAMVVDQKNTHQEHPYHQQAVRLFSSQKSLIKFVYRGLLKNFNYPEQNLPAAEKAAAYAKVFNQISDLDRLYQLSINAIQYAEDLELDVNEERQRLKQSLNKRATNNSFLLEQAINTVKGLKAGVAVLPDDTELKAKLQIMENNVRNLGDALSTAVNLLDSQGMGSSIYREQIVLATGHLTPEVLQGEVILNLLINWGNRLLNRIGEDGPTLLFKLILFIIILFIFKKLSQLTKAITKRALSRSTTELSTLLHRMLVSLAGNLVFLLGILIALSQIGVALGPVLTGLGVAGFVIGFAVQDSLSNFASGVMILASRPFDVGDFIEAGGAKGTVSNMNLISTTILTLDNQTLIVPNNKIWGGVIRNVTSQKLRRINLDFHVTYDTDTEKVESIFRSLIDAEDRILKEPAPLIHINKLTDTSVNFIVFPWVKTKDYWDVRWAMMRAVKERFAAEGIDAPYPQQKIQIKHNEL
jgi:small conductance mechanosensitive channel